MVADANPGKYEVDWVCAHDQIQICDSRSISISFSNYLKRMVMNCEFVFDYERLNKYHDAVKLRPTQDLCIHIIYGAPPRSQTASFAV
jgi:hypothetical protein